MYTATRTSTTDMEVTSIRLERELKERLKELSGNQGYQALIRDILWDYIHQKSGNFTPQLSRTDIRATFPATAQQDDRCALTGRPIRTDDSILLAYTQTGDLVPLTLDSLQD